MKKLLCITALLTLSACATVPTTSKAQADAAIRAAHTAYHKAVKVDFAWLKTGKMIKKAEALEAKGNYTAAVTLADQAKRQGEAAYQQYLSQRGATGPRMN